jgi:hypothetical protein
MKQLYRFSPLVGKLTLIFGVLLSIQAHATQYTPVKNNPFTPVREDLLALKALQENQKFKMPDLKRRYNEVTWPISHNSPFSKKDGFVYYNHEQDILTQYQLGAKGFELDIEKRCWSKVGPFGTSGCTISLCHESCEITKLLQPRASGLFESTGDPNGFKSYALATIKKILTENPNEILTITLENRVKDYRDLDKEFEAAGLQNFILKPSDWDPVKNQGWPTLEWMINNNKRLVVFNDRAPWDQEYQSSIPYASSNYTFYQWPMIVQNQWGGAKDINTALKERGSSQRDNMGYTRYLYEFDWFADGGKITGGISDLISKAAGLFNKETPFTGDSKKMNSTDLRKAISTAVAQGLTSGRARGRYPNFIKIDFFGDGDAVQQANEINTMANDPEKRKIMYAPIK